MRPGFLLGGEHRQLSGALAEDVCPAYRASTNGFGVLEFYIAPEVKKVSVSNGGPKNVGS